MSPEMERLAARRAELIERIGRLRPHAFRRIELEARLAEVTRRQLELAVAEAAAAQTEIDQGRPLKWFQQ